MSKGHPSPSQRLSLRGMSPSLRAGGLSEPEAGAEPEPAATFTRWSNGIYSTGQALPPAYRRAGIKGGEILLENLFDELVKSHIPYVVHASTSSARTEYQ